MKIFSKIGCCIIALAIMMPLKGMEEEEKGKWYFTLRGNFSGAVVTTESEIKNKIKSLKKVAQEAGLNKPGSNLVMLLYLRKTATEKGGQLGVSGTSASEGDISAWKQLLEKYNLISKSGFLDSVVKQLLIVSEGAPNSLDWNYLTRARRILNDEEGIDFIKRDAKRKSESDPIGEVWYFELPFDTDYLKTTKKAIEEVYNKLTKLTPTQFLYFADLISASEMFPKPVNMEIEKNLKEQGLLGKDGKPMLLAEFLYGCAMRPFSETMEQKLSVKEMFKPLKELFGSKIYLKRE